MIILFLKTKLNGLTFYLIKVLFRPQDRNHDLVCLVVILSFPGTVSALQIQALFRQFVQWHLFPSVVFD